MLANCELAEACLHGFLENILGSLYVSLDTLSNAFCSIFTQFWMGICN